MTPLDREKRVRFLVCLSVTATFSWFTITLFCGHLFSCGCTLVDGLRHCNVFSSTGPRCPWCSQGPALFWSTFGVIVTAAGFTIWSSLQWIKDSFWMGILAGLLGYFLWGSLIGLGSALYYQYPTVYGLNL